MQRIRGKRWKAAWVASAIGIAAVSLAACSSSGGGGGGNDQQASKSTELTLTVGIQSFSDYSMIAVLPYQEGYFNQLHLNVKYVAISSDSAGEAALESGSVDVLTSGAEGLVTDQKGGDVRQIAATANRSTAHFITSKSITSLKQLDSESTPIGWAGPSSALGQSMELGLQASGVDVSKLHLVTLGSSSLSLKSLLANKIIGAPLASPSYLVAVGSGYKDWGSTDGQPPNGLGAPPTISGAFLTTTKTLQSKGQALQRFLIGFRASLQDLFNPAVRPSLATLMSKDLGVDAKYVQTDYQTFFANPATKGTYMNEDGTTNMAATVNTCQAYVKFQLIPAGTNCTQLSDELVDNGPLAQAGSYLAAHPLKQRLATPLASPISAT